MRCRFAVNTGTLEWGWWWWLW